jgi:hypothetical protein
MSRDLLEQLHAYRSDLEEAVNPLVLDDLASRRVGTGAVRPFAPRDSVRRLGGDAVPRWVYAVVATLLVLIVVGTALLVRLNRESSPVVTDPELPRTTVPAPTTVAAPTSTVPAGFNPAPITTEPGAPEGASYEAVFLRLEVAAGIPEVVVLGVNTVGVERQIARLTGAWLAYTSSSLGGGYLAPMGAVSPGGLLAIPSGALWNMQWMVYDLHNPQAEPIVVPGIIQDFEQFSLTPYFSLNEGRPGVFWGPDDRLAIPWYHRSSIAVRWQLAFVEGRTGATSSVAVPDGMTILPRWTADGLGVFLSSANDRDTPIAFLKADSIVYEIDAAAPIPESACITHYQSGAVISVSGDRVLLRDPDGSDAELPSEDARFACLAPDESAIVFTFGALVDGSGPAVGGSASHPMAGLILPGSDTFITIEGSFAGWMQVSP